jgi:hypothetical protein
VQRFRRIVAYGIVGGSSLLLLVVIALWVASHWVAWRWARTTVTHKDVVQARQVQFLLLRGSMGFRSESRRFYSTPEQSKEMPDFLRPPRSDIGAVLRRNLPAGQSCSAGTISPDDAERLLGGHPGFWGFFSAREVSDPPRPKDAPTTDGDRITHYFGSTTVGGNDVVYLLENTAWAVPYWLPATFLVWPPLVALLYANVARRARRTGRCPKCGYDLRATPDRCPECGTPTAPSAL